MAGINFVRRWVMGQMTKKADDGIMITLPDSSKVDLNVNITMDRLLRNGFDPDAFTNPQQVDNAVNMINSRIVERAIPANSAEGREITEKLFFKFSYTALPTKPLPIIPIFILTPFLVAFLYSVAVAIEVLR